MVAILLLAASAAAYVPRTPFVTLRRASASPFVMCTTVDDTIVDDSLSPEQKEAMLLAAKSSKFYPMMNKPVVNPESWIKIKAEHPALDGLDDAALTAAFAETKRGEQAWR